MAVNVAQIQGCLGEVVLDPMQLSMYLQRVPVNNPIRQPDRFPPCHVILYRNVGTWDVGMFIGAFAFFPDSCGSQGLRKPSEGYDRTRIDK